MKAQRGSASETVLDALKRHEDGPQVPQFRL